MDFGLQNGDLEMYETLKNECKDSAKNILMTYLEKTTEFRGVLVKHIIEQGDNLNYRVGTVTALTILVHKRNTRINEVLKILIDAGADPCLKSTENLLFHYIRDREQILDYINP
jgi:hypothetical protein